VLSIGVDDTKRCFGNLERNYVTRWIKDFQQELTINDLSKDPSFENRVLSGNTPAINSSGVKDIGAVRLVVSDRE
jgi:hypothetical protein